MKHIPLSVIETWNKNLSALSNDALILAWNKYCKDGKGDATKYFQEEALTRHIVLPE